MAEVQTLEEQTLVDQHVDEGECTGELVRTVYGPEASPNGFEALADEWDALLARSVYDSFFLTHLWQTTWWTHLREGELWILAVREPGSGEAGELVGIVPFYLVEDGGTRRFSLVGCLEVSDYLDAIIARGQEEQVYRSLLGWLRDEAPAWDELDLCNLPQTSLIHQLLPGLSEEFGWSSDVFREDVAPQFALPLRYETYLQEQVEKKQRHEIRRKQRRAEREHHVDFYIVGDRPDDDVRYNLEAEMDDFVALQRASREDKAEFMTPPMRRFFQGMAQSQLDAGQLRLAFLVLDGEKVAATLAFSHQRRMLLYNSGYDPDERFAQLSPGWVLLAYLIQYSIATGHQLFDFLQGDEEYKYRFGSQDWNVMRVIVRNHEEK